MNGPVKRHSISVTLSTLISVCTLIGLFWLFAKPWVASAVADELRADIAEAVQDEVAPLKASSQVMLIGQISQTRREIARLDYRKRRAERDEDVSWTAEDAVMLSDLKDTLNTQQSALEQLE